jgi:hypothetical protein
MTPTGSELAQKYSNFGDAPKCAAEINAVDDNVRSIDPDLPEIIEAWPALPQLVRGDILAFVRKALAADQPNPPCQYDRT